MGGFSTSHFRLRYKPSLVAANTTVQITSDSVGGFLCQTSGTIQFGVYNEQGTIDYLAPAIPVSAGTWLDTPFYLGPRGGVIVSSGGAVGVLGT